MKVLSDAEENDSGPFNRGGIADLPLLRTLLALCQKSGETNFWKVDFLFYKYMQVWQLQDLLKKMRAYLHFALDSEDLFC